MRPRFFVRAGVIATTLLGVGWGALWAAERAAPAQRITVETSAPRQLILRREDFRPTLKNPSADAREFFFTRAIYSGGGYRWGSWATDYPKADRQFLAIIGRLIDLLDAYERENAVRLDDPDLRRFPFLYALEVGHMSIDWSTTAPQCQCGNRGCLEALASGTAIAAAAQERLAGGEWPGSSMAAGAGDQITAESVFQAAATGDELALSILEEVLQALAVGLGNVLHLYNPDLLVLGGGVTSGFIQLGLLPRIESLTKDRAMTRRHSDFRLVPAKLADAAGLVGAATKVWQMAGPA